MSKKILLLGGSHGQIPAIKEAKRRGLYTILCDYLTDNPGQHLVDEFHLVSTTDQDKVLELAQEKQIDYILAYGSDPAVLTSAYVSSILGLKGNNPDSIELLSHKDLFRYFQRENNFNTPRFQVLTNKKETSLQELKGLLPAVVKPVDSSDTKGVTMVENTSEFSKAVEHAFNFSRCGRAIVEEKVDNQNADLHGDGFVMNGDLCFCELGDHLYKSISDPLKPSSTIFPSRKGKELLDEVKKILKDIIRMSGYKNGPVNIEVRIDSDGKIYVMEIGPRNGGSYIPQTIFHSTGFNMLEAIFDWILGKEVNISRIEQKPAICFTLHSNKNGIFDFFKIDEGLAPFLKEEHLFISTGKPVKSYNQPGSSLGALIFKFDDSEQVDEHLDNFYQQVVDGIHLKNSE